MKCVLEGHGVINSETTCRTTCKTAIVLVKSYIDDLFFTTFHYFKLKISQYLY